MDFIFELVNIVGVTGEGLRRFVKFVIKDSFFRIFESLCKCFFLVRKLGN